MLWAKNATAGFEGVPKQRLGLFMTTLITDILGEFVQRSERIGMLRAPL